MIIDRNPFPAMAKRDPAHLVVMFLKEPADAARVKRLQAAIVGPEIVRGAGKQLYIVYPDGIRESRLTYSVIDKALETRGTGRNWNTVLKLGTLVNA